MSEGITRREFIDGIACAVVAGGAMARSAHGAEAGSYPPARAGFTGSRAADYQVAHGVRDGRRYAIAGQPVAAHYDLVVIGAGLGGLAAAHFVRQARPGARILILDNHDDFGGHARRNEFNVDGRFLLGYGGSESLEGPRQRWSANAKHCIASIGVDLDRLEAGFNVGLYPGLGLSSGLFFPKEVFGVDRLVTGDPIRALPNEVPAHLHHGRPPAEFIADWPLDDARKALLVRLYTDTGDVLAGHSQAQKQAILDSLSYHDYLQRYFGLDDQAMAILEGSLLEYLGVSARCVTALEAAGCGHPGFQGLGLQEPPGGTLETDPYAFHFPDGNASLARLFVRALIPGVAAGTGMDDILTARFDYAQLDRPDNPVSLRLSSTVVAIANTHSGVDVLYTQGEAQTRVSAGHAIYAGYGAMLPYICPELHQAQRHAVADQVRTPLVYVNVAVRNWRSWIHSGVHTVSNPAGFYCLVKLDHPVSLGSYRCAVSPDEPVILHLVHVPFPAGPITDLRAALRAARAMLYVRTFEEFEFHARDELTRILGPGGFDADRDIAAITVNRWGHGYAYTPTPLFDTARGAQREQAQALSPIGRIHLAGSDFAWDAFAHKAIDTAWDAARAITG